jgi:hypothetical protein
MNAELVEKIISVLEREDEEILNQFMDEEFELLKQELKTDQDIDFSVISEKDIEDYKGGFISGYVFAIGRLGIMP